MGNLRLKAKRLALETVSVYLATVIDWQNLPLFFIVARRDSEVYVELLTRSFITIMDRIGE